MKATAKPVIPRVLAREDVEHVVSYYLAEATEQVAVGFIDALQQGYGHISRHPTSGISRYGHDLDLPGLFCWPLKRYPYLVFYVERDDHIDVWRVLHAKRDIAQWLADDLIH